MTRPPIVAVPGTTTVDTDRGPRTYVDMVCSHCGVLVAIHEVGSKLKPHPSDCECTLDTSEDPVIDLEVVSE